MSEIKGQLLAIILVLVIFGGISVAVARIFNQTADQVAEKAEDLGKDAKQEITPPSSLSYFGN